MIVELIPAGGLGREPPLRIDASQIIVRYPNGTPFFAAGLYGQDRSVFASMAGMNDFNKCLRSCGENKTVIVDTIEMPEPPPGARLIRGPTGE